MEALELKSAAYWQSKAVDIRINPAANLDIEGLLPEIENRGIDASIVLATSGSTGAPKFIVLSKRALLASAEAVNQWCQITADDIWLGGLSTFHVGGLGIYCRAYLSGSKVNDMEWNRWTRDGSTFLDALKDSTITSLTPVHLHDLVQANISAPDSLRGVFIGGGKLSEELANKAADLGWPLWPTFGMTEACSQIATSTEGYTTRLPILPQWEAKTTGSGILQIKGPALMDGYFARGTDRHWVWQPATESDGYYSCGDRVEINEGTLRPLGRADDLVKILGELVSVGKLEQALSEALGLPAVIIAIPDARRGSTLAAAIETGEDISGAFENWNQSLPPYERVSEMRILQPFPRTEVGKIDRKKIFDAPRGGDA